MIRRAKAWGYDPRNMMLKLLTFHAVPRIEKRASAGGRLLPAQVPPRPAAGNADRESRSRSIRRYAGEILVKHLRFARMYWQHRRILRRVRSTQPCTCDVAMTPVQDGEFEEMQMYTATPATRIAVEKLRRHKRAHAPSG